MGLMGLTGLARRVWDRVSRVWRTPSGGTAATADEVAHLAGVTQANMERLTRRLQAGELNLSQWQLGMAAEIKDASLAQAMLAHGGRAGLRGIAVRRRVRDVVRGQLDFLSRFARDIAEGRVTEGQAVTRARMYGSATTQNYWNEYARQRGKREWAHLPQLPTTPRAGDTQCRVNCKCTLEEREDGIHWVLHPAEHCQDCIDLAAGGPYRP